MCKKPGKLLPILAALVMLLSLIPPLSGMARQPLNAEIPAAGIAVGDYIYMGAL